MFLVMASFIMGRVSSTCHADQKLQYIYMLLPAFSVGYGFVKVCATRCVFTRADAVTAVFRVQLAFLDILPSLDASCDGGIKPGSAVRAASNPLTPSCIVLTLVPASPCVCVLVCVCVCVFGRMRVRVAS